ncbi:hypothetical protein [Synechococcus sp. BS55D]|uniref:hypothetical protein n=1 Tax=Synechococcus sp. BS55D TaxID=2055943 RepID=UPI001376087E|nr:hypothetical protein [Synechococcus sp. BS55D]
MSIDNHNRQRGNDEADASLLVEGENFAEEVDVVIGAVESNEADHKAADQLDAALGIKTKEPGTALLFGFWRNLSVLVDTRGDMHRFGITVAHSADRPESITLGTRVRPAVGGPRRYGNGRQTACDQDRFSSWSYWAWVPIHTHSNTSGDASTASARCRRPARTDQNRPMRLRWSEG